MGNSLSPYDLGNFFVAENCQRISVDELVRKANKMLRRRLVEAQIEALGISVQLATSKTLFHGERFWFLCSLCGKRKGVLYRHPAVGLIGCRTCLKLKYIKQRFKVMVEISQK